MRADIETSSWLSATAPWAGPRALLRPHPGRGGRRPHSAALEEQLVEGGILVIPIGRPTSQMLEAFHKVGDRLQAEPLSACRFVPLVGAQQPSE